MTFSSLLESILRARAAIYCVLAAAFTLLALYETAHLIVQHADAVPLLLMAGFTAGLGFQTRRLYRRSMGQNPRTGRADEDAAQSQPNGPTA